MTASFAYLRRSLYGIACFMVLSAPAAAQVAPELTAAEQAVQRATQADADLAKARSEEAVVSAQLEQRRKEVAQLQNSLNTGEGGR